MGDPSWKAVEVDASGWRVIDRPAARFRRSGGLRPLPGPQSGATIQELRPFINVSDSDDLLFLAWLTAALRPAGPYPILVLSGEQGSAKSTTARVARWLIDPHASPLRSDPRDERDLMIGAANNWIVALDNLSFMPTWLSDALCRLATGGTFATRALYTDGEEFFLEAQRPVILTGIEDVEDRGDLIDRSLFLHLPTIPEAGRRTEAEFWRAFDSAHPRLFGALLDTMGGGLRLLPEVRLERLPRMADFALWGEAVSRSLGKRPGDFLAVYDANRRTANDTALENSPVASAVRSLAGRGAWSGTASALLPELATLAGERAAMSRVWPKSPKSLSGKLRRLAPALRMIGISVGFDREPTSRLITISPADKTGDVASDASSTSSGPGPRDAHDAPDARIRGLSGEPPRSREIIEL